MHLQLPVLFQFVELTSMLRGAVPGNFFIQIIICEEILVDIAIFQAVVNKTVSVAIAFRSVKRSNYVKCLVLRDGTMRDSFRNDMRSFPLFHSFSRARFR